MLDPRMTLPREATASRVVGRYALYDPLAVGGMATVHIGRLLGPVGFARTVAIKRLHPQFARNPEFVSMFLDEARMCARIRHPNVVPTLDVVAIQGELFLVMEYVQGESLANLVRAMRVKGQKVPWKVATTIASGALYGLHAAHEARDERGTPMDLVHRDVSPQNILVGIDGMARVVDFGIAKATGRIHTTRDRAVKGKLGYMAYEQMSCGEITRQADIYAAAVVLWETLACHRLFDGDTEAVVLTKLLTQEVPPPSMFAPEIPKELDELVLKGLSRDANERFSTAREMAQALDRIGTCPIGIVGEWVESVAKAALEERASKVAAVEIGGGSLPPNERGPRESQLALSAVEEPQPATITRAEPRHSIPMNRPPRRLILIGVAGAIAVGGGGWTVLHGEEQAPASPREPPQQTTVYVVPGPTVRAEATPVVRPVETGEAAVAEEQGDQAKRSQESQPPGKLQGRLPALSPPSSAPSSSTPAPSSPWSLGGRK